MKLELLLLLTLSTIVFGQQECSSYTVTNEWQGGQQGTLAFTLDHEVHGWQLTIKFHIPFDTFTVSIKILRLIDQMFVEVDSCKCSLHV